MNKEWLDNIICTKKQKSEIIEWCQYIGFERYESVVCRALEKLENTGLTNVKIICIDAFELGEVFDKEISTIYLNFSDPWPKSRHEKRRLTSDSFLNVYREIKASDGVIEFKTDNRGLFEYSVMSLNNNGFEFLDISFDLHNDGRENIVTTEYEDRFSAKGNVIYFIKVKEK